MRKPVRYLVLFNRTVSIYRFDPRHYTHPAQKNQGHRDRYRQPYSRFDGRYYWYVFNRTWWARPEGIRKEILDEPYQLDEHGEVISFAYTDIVRPERKFLRKVATQKVFRREHYFFIVLPHYRTIRIYGSLAKVLRYCSRDYCRLWRYTDDLKIGYNDECKTIASSSIQDLLLHLQA